METTTLKSVASAGVQSPAVKPSPAHLRQPPVKSEGATELAKAGSTRVEAPSVQQKQDEPTKEALKNAVETVNRAIKEKTSNELRFSVDEETGISVVKVLDQKTGEVVRQVPAQEMLEIAKSIDQMSGLLVKQKV